MFSLLVAAALVAACQTDSAVETDTASMRRAPSTDALLPQPASFSPAIDGGPCVSDEEISAEQMIQLHTTMMVTGLTCHGAFRDPDLFNRYQDFTVAHSDRIIGSQGTLERYLGRSRGGNRARLFDSYRTRMANHEAQLVMSMSASRYCRDQYDRFYTIAEFSPSELEGYLNRVVDRYRDRYAACGGSAT
jgi:hypothetical protein